MMASPTPTRLQMLAIFVCVVIPIFWLPLTLMLVFLAVTAAVGLIALKNPRALIALPISLMLITSFWVVVEAPFNYSPDEKDHVAAVNYYVSERWMPPEIGSAEAKIAERPHYATTYLYTHDKSYLLLGKIAWLLGVTSADETTVVFFRLIMWSLALAALIFLARLNQGAIFPLLVLPQFFYFTTYVNGESLAIVAAVSGFTAALLYQRTNHAVFAGLCALIAFCAIFLKPSFYIIHIFNAALVVLHTVQSNRLRHVILAPGFLTLFCAGAAILGVFVWMEIAMYGVESICTAGIGKCSDLALYQVENATRARDSIVANSGATRLDMLLSGHWIWSSLKSLVGVFGYMTNPIARGLILVSLILLSAYFVYAIVYLSRSKPIFAFFFLISMCFVVYLSIEYSYSYDYQPQGKYIIAAVLLLSFFGPLSNWSTQDGDETNAHHFDGLNRAFETAFTVWGVWMACAFAYRMAKAFEI